MPVRNWQTNIFGDVDASQQRALLVAGWASASLLARKGDEHFIFAIRATNSSKTFMQVTALKIGCYRPLNNGPLETVLDLKTLIVDLLERIKMLVDQTPQFGCTRIPWLVQYGQFGTGGNHEENALSGSQVGYRKTHSPSILSRVDRPKATAWKYTRQIVYARTI